MISTQVVQLPPELDDYIVSFLSDNPKALRQCALVCRAWLASCRKVLYHKVTIETEDQFDAFEQAVISSPYIQECVHILQVDRSEQEYKLAYPWINTKLALKLPKQLRKLHTLELIKVEERWKSASFTKLATFVTLKTLSIVSCSMSPAELHSLLGAFSQLENLRIEHFVDLFSGRVQVASLPSDLRLIRLALLTDNLPSSRDVDFLQWILRTSTKNTLRELSIAIGKQDLFARSRFIQGLGSSLEHLEIRSIRRYGRTPTDCDDIIKSINLAANTRLRSLTLPFTHFRLLRQVVAPHLVQINFRVSIYTLKDLIPIELDETFRELLSKSTHHSLREVQVLYTSALSTDAILDVVSNGLPTLAERNMLRITRDSERHVAI